MRELVRKGKGCLFSDPGGTAILALAFAALFIQCGNGGSFLPRELIRSISFEDRDGFHLLVLRCVTKRGKSFERTVVASTKYSDDDVAKFLFDIGMVHLWNAGIEV